MSLTLLKVRNTMVPSINIRQRCCHAACWHVLQLFLRASGSMGPCRQAPRVCVCKAPVAMRSVIEGEGLGAAVRRKKRRGRAVLPPGFALSPSVACTSCSAGAASRPCRAGIVADGQVRLGHAPMFALCAHKVHAALLLPCMFGVGCVPLLFWGATLNVSGAHQPAHGQQLAAGAGRLWLVRAP